MIDALTKLVIGELTDLQRRVIVSLVTTDVHARDIVEECKQMNVNQVHDFKW
jgi:dynein heavy chain